MTAVLVVLLLVGLAELLFSAISSTLVLVITGRAVARRLAGGRR